MVVPLLVAAVVVVRSSGKPVVESVHLVALGVLVALSVLVAFLLASWEAEGQSFHKDSERRRLLAALGEQEALRQHCSC